MFIIIVTIMQRLEGLFVSIGISISLENLISQANDTNMKLIMNILHDGFLEEDDTYDRVIRRYYPDENIENDFEFLEYIKKLLTHYGLIDKELLIPIKNIVTLDKNKSTISIPLDFDLSLDLSPFKNIDNYKKVFIVNKKKTN
jgi:hypothetical protein